MTIELLPSDDGATRELDDLRLGIVGTGKLGTTIARAAIAAGYDVAMSGSGPADDIALTVEVLAPGARAVTTDEVVRHADLIILAVPTHRFRELPPGLFDGKILVDAMNYWEPVDGTDRELAAAADGTSTVVQRRFASARLVKSLNQLGYHELDDNRHPRGTHDRIAIGAAGDDRAAVGVVMRLVDRLGFDPVDAGPLENGLALEPDGSPFAVTYSADELSDLIARSRGRAPVLGRSVSATQLAAPSSSRPTSPAPTPSYARSPRTRPRRSAGTSTSSSTTPASTASPTRHAWCTASRSTSTAASLPPGWGETAGSSIAAMACNAP